MINFDSYRFTENWVDDSYPEVPGYWSSIVKNNEYKEMLEIGSYEGRSALHFIDSGIIDPVKVTRTALQNAVSSAGTLMTTKYAIIQTGE